MRVLSSQDFWAGVVFIAIGAFALWAGADYQAGQAARMGPGYVPRLLGFGLVAIGLVVAAQALIKCGARIERGAPKPVLLVIGGTVLFGLLIDRAGLAITVAVVTIVTAFAARERPNLLHVIVLALALSLITALVFVYGLRQAIPIWWES